MTFRAVRLGLLVGAALSVAVSGRAATAVPAVSALLERVGGPALAASFTATLVPASAPPAGCSPQAAELGCAVLTVVPPPRSSSSSSSSSVQVTGTTLSALTYGIGSFLRSHCNASLTWVKTGGLAIPEGCPGPVARLAPLVVERAVRFTSYMNVVDFGYSFVWWGWPRWQVEIDWMALSGVNLALAYTGQEAVYRELYLRHGLNDTQLGAFFNGPAYLPWSRGQGMAGVGGPLPAWWYVQQADLNKKIVGGMRALGITTVLPGFQGNVPVALRALYPKANISKDGWLDALDPLFTTLANTYMSLLIAEFGTDHYYQADGFFNQKRGPWLADTRRHQHADAHANADAHADVDVAPDLDGITPDHDAFLHSQAAYGGLARTDPEAVWVYQTWIWRGFNAAKLPFVKGWIGAVPAGRLLLLDQTAERIPLWAQFGNYSFFNTSFVWCAMHEMGGNIGLFGDASIVSEAPLAALAASPSMAGIGIDPEGIDQNPAYYQLALDNAWRREPVDLKAHFAAWARQRCGAASAAAERAWGLLADTVYAAAPWQHYEHHMKYCPTTMPFGSGWDLPMVKPQYNTSALREAWSLLVAAAPGCPNREPFLYDLVDVGREYLSVAPCVASYGALTSAANETAIRAANASMAGVLSDLDELLRASRGFLLGRWLSDARALAPTQDGADADFLEWNARSQVTSWYPEAAAPGPGHRATGSPVAGGLPGLWDYGNKCWGGLVGGFYARRYQAYADAALAALASHRPFDKDGYHTAVNNLAAAFSLEPWSNATLPDVPVGDPVALSRALLAKYP